MKFILMIKFGLYEVKLHRHWEIEEFNLRAFLVDMSLMKTLLLCFSSHFLEHISDTREHCSCLVTVILRHKIKTGLRHEMLGLQLRKIPSCTVDLNEVKWCM
jgi:hypothetical protein